MTISPPNKQETPRTDAHLSHLNLPDGYKVGLPMETVALLRQLERELAEMKAHADTWLETCRKLEDEQEALSARGEAVAIADVCKQDGCRMQHDIHSLSPKDK